MKKFLSIAVLFSVAMTYLDAGDDFWSTGMRHAVNQDAFTDEIWMSATYSNFLEFDKTVGTIIIQSEEGHAKAIFTTVTEDVAKFFGLYPVILHGYSESDIVYRFDENKAVTCIGALSSTRNSVFIPDSEFPGFISGIMNSEILRVRLKAYDGTNIDMTFNNLAAFRSELEAIEVR